jgi:probable HAF family extracellular repeat protein
MLAVGAEFGKLPAAVLLAVTLLAPGAAQAATFQGLGLTTGAAVNALSADGSAVVGTNNGHAFRWTATSGAVDLGAPPGFDQSSGLAVSANGSVVVGASNPSGGFAHPVLWTAATGMVDLGLFPNDLSGGAIGVSADGSAAMGFSVDKCCTSSPLAFRWTAATGLVRIGLFPGSISSVPTGISADGSVVVGTTNGVIAFRWTAATGTVNLGNLPGEVAAQALGVSANGSAVVGKSCATTGFQGCHAFLWTAAGGMVDLGLLPGDTIAQATMVSADGSTVVGTSSPSNGTPIHLFRWTAATGLVDLGGLPGQVSAFFKGLSSDGSVVFGLIGIQNPGHNTPFRWTAATGVQAVQDLLAQSGANLTGWTLTGAAGLSADGNTMTGTGTDPTGNTSQGWIGSLSAGPAQTSLVASVLPSSRSVQVGTTLTVFATIINAGASTASSVGISLASPIPATLTYNQTDCGITVIGGTNVPVNIPPGGKACYVISMTPSAPFAPTEVVFNFSGTNTPPVATLIAINTLLLSASLTPVPDIEALAATITGDLILHIPGSAGVGAFAVATDNVGGAGGVITASMNTGSAALPLGLSICQTDPMSGACITPVGPSVNVPMAPGATSTFGIFATAGGTILLDPAANRIFVVFTDSGGVIRGRTSVAVTTQ